jgi:hypothetical protein
MFYLAVVFKKGDVVDRRFDAQDQRELVVHFDRNWPPMVCLIRVPSIRILKRFPISS